VVAQGDAVEEGEPMKLTFTCPECDTLIQKSDIAMTEYSGHWGFHDIVTCPKCPKCAKLRYGPLTEGMVAEALRKADQQSFRDGGAYKGMARFVLRFLNDLYPKGGLAPFPPSDGDREDWRKWLFDMARQK